MTDAPGEIRKARCHYCNHAVRLFHDARGRCSICSYGTGHYSPMCAGGVRPTVALDGDSIFAWPVGKAL